MSEGPIIIGIDPARDGADATVIVRALDNHAVEMLYLVDAGTVATTDRILDLLLVPAVANYGLEDLRASLADHKIEALSPSEREALRPWPEPILHNMHTDLHNMQRPRCISHAAARRDHRRRRRTRWLAELRC